MRKKLSFIVLIILSTVSCDPYLEFIPPNQNNVVPEVLEPEESEDDPQQTGVSCDVSHSRNTITELLDPIEIPDNLPNSYDLSHLMPPVRSQGGQGSCVSWATTYYLKSYQEKIQYNYEYTSYEEVMSPAYVYNQTKANENCNSGSSIAVALDLLKNQGVISWKKFPYSDDSCSMLPTASQLEKAEENRIEDYFAVGIPDTNTDPNYTLINLIKTLVSQDNPIIISIDIANMHFSYLDNLTNDYIATGYSDDPEDGCGHAVLIVGYDDELNAFKFVNSWGTSWGNDGYAWIDYNFFLPPNEPDYIEGFSNAFIAYDKEETDDDTEN